MDLIVCSLPHCNTLTKVRQNIYGVHRTRKFCRKSNCIYTERLLIALTPCFLLMSYAVRTSTWKRKYLGKIAKLFVVYTTTLGKVNLISHIFSFMQQLCRLDESGIFVGSTKKNCFYRQICQRLSGTQWKLYLFTETNHY